MRSGKRRGLLAALRYPLAWSAWILAAAWSAQHGAVLAAAASLAAIAAVAWRVRRIRRGGQTVRGLAAQRRALARSRLDDAGKLRASTPIAAGLAALASFPAAILALAATGSFGAKGVTLPPASDARWQLWIIVIAALGAVAAIDCWLGAGTTVRALAADGYSTASVAGTVALAALPSLLVFGRVEARPAWLAVIAVQFGWMLGGPLLGGIVAGRRQRQLSPPPGPVSSDAWLAEQGIRVGYDVILHTAGDRKILVARAVQTLTGMRPKAAKDLVDNAPQLVLRQVASDRASTARDLLESLGATVIVR
jgi:hypothetical protein